MDARAANLRNELERTKIKLGLGYLYEVLLHKTAEFVHDEASKINEDDLILSGVRQFMEEKHGKPIQPVQAG